MIVSGMSQGFGLCEYDYIDYGRRFDTHRVRDHSLTKSCSDILCGVYSDWKS